MSRGGSERRTETGSSCHSFLNEMAAGGERKLFFPNLRQP